MKSSNGEEEVEQQCSTSSNDGNPPAEEPNQWEDWTQTPEMQARAEEEVTCSTDPPLAPPQMPPTQPFPCPPEEFQLPPSQQAMPTQALPAPVAYKAPPYKAPPARLGSTTPTGPPGNHGFGRGLARTHPSWAAAPPPPTNTVSPPVLDGEDILNRLASASDGQQFYGTLSDSDKAALLEAGRKKMQSGMIKLQNTRNAIQEKRTKVELQHATIQEEEEGCDGHGGGGWTAALGDGRNFSRPARQNKAPPANETSVAPPGSQCQWQPPGIAAMNKALEAANPRKVGYTWVHKWKGLKQGQPIPPLDIAMAKYFAKQIGTTDEKYELDFTRNGGIPLFLFNQFYQRWVAPYFKKDHGVPIPYCCLCAKEAWSPAHFYSNDHLKVLRSDPKSWQATWKFPPARPPITSVDHFLKAPDWCTEDDLWNLQDCQSYMVEWANDHLHLSSKATLMDSPVVSEGGDSVEILLGDLTEQVEDLNEQMEAGVLQIKYQANYIECLEKKISHDETKNALAIRKLEDENLAMRQKMNDLQAAMEDMKNNHDDDMKQMQMESAKTSGAQKTSVTGCFRGLF